MSRLLPLVAALCLASCAGGGGAADAGALVGRWREVMPVNKDIVQGVELKADGSAAPVGTGSLRYESWSYEDGGEGAAVVVLSGTASGGGRSFGFSDTLDLVSLDADTLVLGKGDMYRVMYVRER